MASNLIGMSSNLIPLTLPNRNGLQPNSDAYLNLKQATIHVTLSLSLSVRASISIYIVLFSVLSVSISSPSAAPRPKRRCQTGPVTQAIPPQGARHFRHPERQKPNISDISAAPTASSGHHGQKLERQTHLVFQPRIIRLEAGSTSPQPHEPLLRSAMRPHPAPHA